MTTAVARPDAAPDRLSWTIIAAALCAGTTLYLSSGGPAGGGTPLLSLFGAMAVLSLFFRWRLQMPAWAQIGVRVVVYAAIGVVIGNRTTAIVDALLSASSMDVFAHVCAFEIALQAWSRQAPTGSGHYLSMCLSAFIFLAACAVLDMRYVRLIAPFFVLFTILSLHPGRALLRPMRKGVIFEAIIFVRGIAIAASLLLGSGAYVFVYTYRAEIQTFGGRLLHEIPLQPGGISLTPHLGGHGFAEQQSVARVLRIVGPLQADHLRSVAFDQYSGGNWLPAVALRQYVPAVGLVPPGNPRLQYARFSRYGGDSGTVVAPLHVAAILSPDAELEEDRLKLGPIRWKDSPPDSYLLGFSSDEKSAGPLAIPPYGDARSRCLQIPREVEPRVLQLARSIAGPSASPLERIGAITSYLMSHHGYSLNFQPGSGDPLSRFILSDRPAHCEYFGSAATIMLRAVGVPARYVIGYYAHEQPADGVTLVRQRDAHAWCEAWVDGPGWITVDATPAAARPSGFGEALPLITRLQEWVQDIFHAIQSRIMRFRPSARTMALGLAVITVTLFVAKLRKRPIPPPQARAYSAPAELIPIAEKFERLLVERGAPCPPGEAWRRHLAALQNESAAEKPALNFERSFEWLDAYERLRFGAHRTPGEIESLTNELTRL